MVIAADVGGTKTVLGRASIRNGSITLEGVERFEGRQHPTFESVLEQYLEMTGLSGVSGLYIGAAGVTADNRCAVTYLDWIIDGAGLAERFDFDEVVVMNDLEAAGFGLDFLPDSASESINAGRPKEHGTRVLISPGTGLGMAIVPNIGGRYIPVASEGGHAGFAPFDGRTRRLWDFARRIAPRVRVEDFLSGPGFGLLYRFVASETGSEIPADVDKALRDDPGQVVTTLALEKSSPLAAATVDLFLDILASASGDLALTGMALGGVYIGGGVLPRIAPLVNKDRFMAAFSDKGVHQGMLKKTPVKIVMDPLLPLYGAAGYALLSRDRAG